MKSSDECHCSRLQSPFGARLSLGSKALNARTAMKTIENSERKLDPEKALFLARFKRTLDVDSTELSKLRTGQSPQPSTVHVLVRSQSVQQGIFLLLGDGPERRLMEAKS